jgi:hypothetical protein
MGYYSGAFGLGIRDVIGAWLVCLAVAAAFFGYPLVTAAWGAPVVQYRAVADRPLIAAPAEICAQHNPPIALSHGLRAS